jgi:hypothetical protein
MSFVTKVYTGSEVTIALGPVLIESGRADGEFLRVEQESDDTEDVAGADGEVAVSPTKDRRATLTIILLQTADANQGLSALSTLARNSPGMTGAIVPVLVKDRNGSTLYTGQNAWIQRPPDASFDKTAQSREWTVRVANLIRNDGSNNGPS